MIIALYSIRDYSKGVAMMRQRLITFIGLFICTTSSFLTAQDSLTRIVGAEEQQVVLPSLVATQRKDPGAIQELISFLKVTRLSAFRDMTGAGTAVLPGDDAPPLPATISLQGIDKLRLDIQTTEGSGLHLIGAPSSDTVQQRPL